MTLSEKNALLESQIRRLSDKMAAATTAAGRAQYRYARADLIGFRGMLYLYEWRNGRWSVELV